MEWIFAPILQPIIMLRTILTQRFNAGRANALYGAARVRGYPQPLSACLGGRQGRLGASAKPSQSVVGSTDARAECKT
jgi:hypothetical protein